MLMYVKHVKIHLSKKTTMTVFMTLIQVSYVSQHSQLRIG